MKILMLSIDKTILDSFSEAESRMRDYGGVVDELHIIVYTTPGFKEKEIAPNVRVYPTNTAFRPFYFRRAFSLAKKIIRDRKMAPSDSIITSQDAFTNKTALRLRRRFGLPFQVQIHTDFLSPFFRRESWKNYFKYLAYRHSVKRADGIRVVSQRIKKSLISLLKIPESKISVLPVFVDAERIRRQEIAVDLRKKYPNYDFIIMLASRLSAEKNVGMACEVIKEAAKKFPNFLLLVVGSGPLKKEFIDKYQKVPKPVLLFKEGEVGERPKVRPSVIFEDEVPFEILISYYKTANLFLLTSNYEGYGRTILEALLCGLPVFSTDVGAASELIVSGRTGAIFPVGDKNKLSSLIYDILYNFESYRMMKFYAEYTAKDLSAPTKEEYLEKTREGWNKCLR